MKKPSGKYKLLYLLLVSLFYLIACDTSNNTTNNNDNKSNKLEDIKKQGKIIAVTNYNSTDYFIYRGQPMGFQKELLDILAIYLDVKVEIKVINNLEYSFNSLINDECDIIAIGLTTTKERSKIINFTEPIGQTKQVLVQKKPENWLSLSKKEYNNLLIRNQIDLGGKTIYVQKRSAFASRIKNLSEEIGENINIIEIDSLEVEEIISLVSSGDIQYTVCDENVALVNKTYYNNIDVSTAISFPQNLAWAVKKDSDSLLLTVNKCLLEFKKTKEYINLYNKYFKNPRSAIMFQSDYYAVQGGDKISQYDDIVKIYSAEINWDWKLLSSLIFQESRFNHNVKSWAGAFGLMQLMPATANNFGVDSLSSPAANISAGVRYIKWLEKFIATDIKDKDEKVKFILAAYNAGPGHVIDAQKLAEKYGKDPKIWDNNVDFYILHKSNPKYYNDSVVKHGYCRGKEPYLFVREVIGRYEHYNNILTN